MITTICEYCLNEFEDDQINNGVCTSCREDLDLDATVTALTKNLSCSFLPPNRANGTTMVNTSIDEDFDRS